MEILTLQELKEIAVDKNGKDLGKDRGFLEAARINLELSCEL
jgi:hypothetical protein